MIDALRTFISLVVLYIKTIITLGEMCRERSSNPFDYFYR